MMQSKIGWENNSLIHYMDYVHIWQNLKMKVNNPRFLNAADQDVMNMEFPACLEKLPNSTHSSVQVETSKSSSNTFQFPEVTMPCLSSQLEIWNMKWLGFLVLLTLILFSRMHQFLGKKHSFGPFGLGQLLLEAFRCM